MIKRIVLTGGPSSGKTTVLERINKVYTSLGYNVIIIEETATYLIEKGIKPFGENKVKMIDFQELVMRFQLAKEQVVDKAVQMMENNKIIIVYDRGTIDNSAYVNDEEFKEVLSRINGVGNFYELMNKYDLIINLVGSTEYYTTENNKARSEQAEEAIKLGEKTLKSWLGHPKIKIVLPKKEMEEKINEVLNIINNSLQEKQVKRQYKYLVDLKKSNLNYILKNGRIAKIEQTYLWSQEGIEKRLRKIEINNVVAYYLSIYETKENGIKTLIKEKELDKDTYENLLEFQEENTEIINKTRIYFNYKNEYFYLDIFDKNDELGILEINITEDEIVETPDFLYILENVTNNEKYYNKTIASKTKKLLHTI